ncbi:MAG: ATP-binding protein [Spirochaetaceae bacterium]|jgi:signal transduction histidine kinase|nr:ATP-binding protein [Spirochaetaceae bacterium]
MISVISNALKRFNKISPEYIQSLLEYADNKINVLEMVLNSIMIGFIVCAKNNTLLLTNHYSKNMLQIDDFEEGKDFVWQKIKDSELAAFLQKTLESSDRAEEREFVIEKNGACKLLSISVLPLVSKKSINGSLILLEDITEKRAKEIKLYRAENLANLTNAAAGVAHEIKNPLASISIHIQLIQKIINNLIDEPVIKDNYIKFDKHITTAIQEVERLNKTVMDFLFAVRPMELNLIKSDINNLITEIVEFIEPELKEHNIICKLDLEDNIPFVLMDRQFIKQALLNLIKNSMEAITGKGEILLRTEEKGTEIKISVIDNGIGIPEENKSKVFEPYWTTKVKGTGLGLLLVYKIIKEHHGDITLQSKKGGGTCFEISMPVFQKGKSLPVPQET